MSSSSEGLSFDYLAVFGVLAKLKVDYLLVGGLNFYLSHQPVSTQDIDFLIRDTQENRDACEAALIEMAAQWGRTDEDWSPVQNKSKGWLNEQTVFCTLTMYGPVDVFRQISGIPDYDDAKNRSVTQVVKGVPIHLISPEDLLNCQLAISEHDRRHDRVRYLRRILNREEEGQ